MFFLFFAFLCLLQAKQLERKEKELASISSFYKEQLEILEKKVRAEYPCMPSRVNSHNMQLQKCLLAALH